jgi:hypothetical protein
MKDIDIFSCHDDSILMRNYDIGKLKKYSEDKYYRELNMNAKVALFITTKIFIIER